MVNEYSVNLPTRFYYKKKWNKGWINVVNPFRASMVLGTPGSGKSYAIVNNYIKQQIEKGFAMYIYDYKFPDLSEIDQPIPVIVEFKNEDGSDNLKETIEANYRKVKQEILTLVDSEIQRIKNTPALSHLIPDK